jgi:hypothetical protein
MGQPRHGLKLQRRIYAPFTVTGFPVLTGASLRLEQPASNHAFRHSINPFQKGPVLAPLSAEQKCNLAEIVAQKTGTNADFETFCDCLLGLFEDIPGFETSTAAEVLLDEIWVVYREQITVSARTGDRYVSPGSTASPPSSPKTVP